MAPIIRVADVSKRFRLHYDRSLKERILYRRRREAIEDFWALRRVAFEVEPGHTVGLIGANGSGKTTLLKLIAGILTPTDGLVERRGQVAALLELGAGFHPDLTGRENVHLNASIMGLSRSQTDEFFDAIVEFSGIERFIDNPVKFYSSGMSVRLAFAVAVHVEPEILLVDEVLAVGDEPFQRKCLSRIRQFQAEGRTILFVTHGLSMVRDLCDRALMLERGEVLVDGHPSEAIREYRERYEPHAGEEEFESSVSGSGEVLIRDGVITDDAGRPKERFCAGDEIDIEFVLDPQEPVDEPIVGIQIRDNLDMLVWGTTTALKGVQLGRLDRPRRLTFRCTRPPLVEGRYTVTVAIVSADGRRRYYWLDRWLTFRVFTSAADAGLLHLDPVIEVVAQ